MSTTISRLSSIATRDYEVGTTTAVRDDGAEWVILAALRFFLAIGVACHHYRYVMEVHGAFLPEPLRTLSQIDGLGCVWCFFLVSGYSIAASVERDQTRFLARRVLRIYPVYWTCLILSFIPYVITHFHGFQAAAGPYINAPKALDIAINCTGFPCFITPEIAAYAPCWSLACEVVYYLLAPALLRVRSLAGVLMLASMVAYKIIGVQVWSHTLVLPVLELAWIWLAGFMYYQNRENPGAGPILIALVLYALGPDPIYGLTLVALIYGKHVRLPDRLPRIATYLGDLSYPLYLCHYPIYFCLFLTCRTSLYAIPGLYLVASIIVAIGILHLVDYPCRRYFRPRLAA